MNTQIPEPPIPAPIPEAPPTPKQRPNPKPKPQPVMPPPSPKQRGRSANSPGLARRMAAASRTMHDVRRPRPVPLTKRIARVKDLAADLSRELFRPIRPGSAVLAMAEQIRTDAGIVKLTKKASSQPPGIAVGRRGYRDRWCHGSEIVRQLDNAQRH